MNKQDKGNGRRGIEWTDYTWNPVRGCLHDCQWDMPDGTLAICYAKTTAENVAQAAYPNGFEHHYFVPAVLDEPIKLKTPSKIFLDSMSDLMGHWVPTEQIEQVLDVCRRASWHTFQLLTKNAPRLLNFDFPPNVWVGVSMPPDHYMGKPLSQYQRDAMLVKALRVLEYGRSLASVRFMSFEPLSYNVGPILKAMGAPINWAIIGAASSGRNYHQPDPLHVQQLLHTLDKRSIPVFMKGNLTWQPHREEFPV